MDQNHDSQRRRSPESARPPVRPTDGRPNGRPRNYPKFSPPCSANRAQAIALFILSLSVILLHSSSLVGGESTIREVYLRPPQHLNRNHETHKHARHQPPSAEAVGHFTNNNRHSHRPDANQIQHRPPSPSNETATNNLVDYNNNVSFKQRRPQVPEQSPILVSSSDNSYVSASPIEASTSHTNRIRHHLTQTRIDPTREDSHQQQHPNRARQSWLPEQRPVTHSGSRNNLFDSQTTMVERKRIAGHHNDRSEYDEHEEEEQQQEEADDGREIHRYELGDRTLQTGDADISTTATTTQRNRNRHTVQKSPDHNDGRALGSKLTSRQQLDDQNQIKSSGNSTERIDRNKLSLKARYSIRPASIIRTRESLDSGATFINYTIVTNLNACLVECWITESCDTTIYQESPVDFNSHRPELSYERQRHSLSLNSLLSRSTSSIIDNIIDDRGEEDADEDDRAENESERSNLTGDLDSSNTDSASFGTIRKERPSEVGFFVCYLFECAKQDGFKCQFSAHNYYVSALKRSAIANTVDASEEYPSIDRQVGILNLEKGPREEGDEEVVVTQQVNRIINDQAYLNPVEQQQNKQNDSLNFNKSANMSNMDEDLMSSAIEDSSMMQHGSCPSDEFKCLNEVKCIPKQFRCDGVVQCSDHSDESRCEPSQLVAGQSDSNAYTVIETNKEQDGSHIAGGIANLKSSHQRSASQSDLQFSNLISPHARPEKIDYEEVSLNNIQDQKFSVGPFMGVSRHPVDPAEIGALANEKTHYSHIIGGMNHHKFNSKKPWHDSHISSIRIGQEEFEDFGEGGLNSAIIAIVIGFGATGVLIMIVGHKMKSIRSRLAHKSRRRSLVPDTDFLINTIPI